MAPKSKKEDKYVTVYSPVGLVSYPCLLTPYQGKPTDEPKFSVEIFVPKANFLKEGKALVEGVLKVAQRYNPEWKKLTDFKGPFLDVDKEMPKDNIKNYQRGCIRIRSSSNVEYKPSVIGPQKIDDEFLVWTDEQVRTIKGGDFGRVICNPYGYNNRGNTGISLGLNFFQFAKVGKPIGEGRMAALKQLEEIEVEIDSPDDMVDTEDKTSTEEINPMLAFG